MGSGEIGNILSLLQRRTGGLHDQGAVGLLPLHGLTVVAVSTDKNDSANSVFCQEVQQSLSFVLRFLIVSFSTHSSGNNLGAVGDDFDWSA